MAAVSFGVGVDWVWDMLHWATLQHLLVLTRARVVVRESGWDLCTCWIMCELVWGWTTYGWTIIPKSKNQNGCLLAGQDCCPFQDRSWAKLTWAKNLPLFMRSDNWRWADKGAGVGGVSSVRIQSWVQLDSSAHWCVWKLNETSLLHMPAFTGTRAASGPGEV